MSDATPNLDARTVAGFGAEWSTFDQADVPLEELTKTFAAYFSLFPWETLPEDAVGFDMGCGSGRWARFVAPKVGRLHCVDASPQALETARVNLGGFSNCVLHQASVDELPFAEGSMDFGYSLGVLHHVPDTGAALRSCVRVLRPGAPFLVYLYYALDNRPAWYRALWRGSDVLRKGISRLPHRARYLLSGIIAALVYWPLARAALIAERAGWPVPNFPLGFYRHRGFYTMRTDAYDRLGTRLEHRFTAAEIRSMMEQAGLTKVSISPGAPFWCALGTRALPGAGTRGDAISRSAPGPEVGGKDG